jgi:hypothetical protein
MITYTYSIKELQRNAEGIIIFACYTITADDGVNSNTPIFHTAFAPPKSNIIPFEELNEERVVNWIKGMFTVVDDDGNPSNTNEEQALGELEAYIQRAQVQTGLPW